MKQLSVLNRRVFGIAFTIFVFGIAGTAHVQSETSGSGIGGTSASTSNKKDPSNAGKGGGNGNKSGSSSRGKGSDAARDKSLGNSAPGTANRKPKEGSHSSLGGSTDQGFTNLKEDTSKKGSRGDRN